LPLQLSSLPVTRPPPVPIVTNAAAIASGLKVEATSSNDRFKKLLTDSGGALLTGDVLRQLTIFHFNNQVSTFPISTRTRTSSSP
jgi:hypothetical protein